KMSKLSPDQLYAPSTGFHSQLPIFAAVCANLNCATLSLREASARFLSSTLRSSSSTIRVRRCAEMATNTSALAVIARFVQCTQEAWAWTGDGARPKPANVNTTNKKVARHNQTSERVQTQSAIAKQQKIAMLTSPGT